MDRMRRMSNAASPRVLAGYRVIEHGEFITGPFAAMLLADMGAEVIKVERPDIGDRFRSFESGLYGPQFQAFNRNKQSITLDLEQSEDRFVLHQLIASADVYLQNFRPGVIERLGFGHDTVRAANPRLVYCSISGFGETGPYAHRPAYDTVAQAFSGYLSLFASADAPRMVGPATADSVTGMYAAIGILGALLERHATGKGRLVEIAMMAATAHFAIEQYHHYFSTGIVPGPGDRGRVSQSFAFRCSDGKGLALHLSSPVPFWEGLIKAIDSPALARDPRFARRMDRVHNHEALESELRAIFATRPRDEWLHRLDAADVPHAPILTLDEVVRDPQARELGIEQTVRHPTEGEVRTIGNPIVFDGAPGPLNPPPTLDEQGPAIRGALAARAKPGASNKDIP
jgi:crotonobetainyl-CoA:carnitine CoA-transferase CaiB-like acyl-CoA transferase